MQSTNNPNSVQFEPEEKELEPNKIIQENIGTIIEHRRETARKRSFSDVVADTITDFSGRMLFVSIHIVWFAAWILLNSGRFGVEPFDPFPYGLLTMVVSLEAIFLSAFVLISQNRMSRLDQQRAELDLQINLLTERELTRALIMLSEIQAHIGMSLEHDEEMLELMKTTKTDQVIRQIEIEEEMEAETKQEEQAADKETGMV